MSMFGPRPGSWWLSSKLDPRWEAVGDGAVGGLVMSHDQVLALAELKKKYGEPPDDLSWGYMKD